MHQGLVSQQVILYPLRMIRGALNCLCCLVLHCAGLSCVCFLVVHVVVFVCFVCSPFGIVCLLFPAWGFLTLFLCSSSFFLPSIQSGRCFTPCRQVSHRVESHSGWRDWRRHHECRCFGRGDSESVRVAIGSGIPSIADCDGLQQGIGCCCCWWWGNVWNVDVCEFKSWQREDLKDSVGRYCGFRDTGLLYSQLLLVCILVYILRSIHAIAPNDWCLVYSN